MNRNFKHTSMLLLFLLPLISSIIIGCSKKEGQKRNDIPVPVRSQAASIGNIEEYVSGAGTILPFRKVKPASKLMSEIIKLENEIGDYVKTNDILFILDSDELLAEKAKAEASLQSAIAGLKKAEIDFERAKKLRENEATSKEYYDNAQTGLDLAKANKKLAEASLKKVNIMLSYTQVSAPISGYITKKFFEKGDTTIPGKPIIEIQDISKVKVNVWISEKEILFINKGAPVIIKIDAIPSQVFEGEVARIFPAGDNQSHSFQVEILINNDKAIIKPSMFTKVKILKAKKENVILAPTISLINQDGKFFCFVLNSKDLTTVERREVEIGLSNDLFTEITSGINPKDEIIIDGKESLVNGSHVRLIKDSK